MNTIKVLFLFSFLVSTVLISCSKDDSTTDSSTITQAVSDITVKTKDQTVIISWLLTNEKDYAKTVVTFSKAGKDTSIDVLRGTNTVTISGLENDVNYSFLLKSYGYSGKSIFCDTVKASPSLKLEVFKGQGFYDGIYKGDDNRYFRFLADSNSNTRVAEIDTFFTTSKYNSLLGIWSRKLDVGDDVSISFLSTSISTKDTATKTTSTIAGYTQLSYNSAFTYVNDSVRTLVCSPFEKVSGDNETLEGKYTSYYSRVAYSYDDPNTRTYLVEKRELVISASTWVLTLSSLTYIQDMTGGTKTVKVDQSNTYRGSWTAEDVRSGKFIFVTYGEKVFLISKWNTLYKQVDTSF